MTVFESIKKLNNVHYYVYNNNEANVFRRNIFSKSIRQRKVNVISLEIFSYRLIILMIKLYINDRILSIKSQSFQ